MLITKIWFSSSASPQTPELWPNASLSQQGPDSCYLWHGNKGLLWPFCEASCFPLWLQRWHGWGKGSLALLPRRLSRTFFGFQTQKLGEGLGRGRSFESRNCIGGYISSPIWEIWGRFPWLSGQRNCREGSWALWTDIALRVGVGVGQFSLLFDLGNPMEGLHWLKDGGPSLGFWTWRLSRVWLALRPRECGNLKREYFLALWNFFSLWFNSLLIPPSCSLHDSVLQT